MIVVQEVNVCQRVFFAELIKIELVSVIIPKMAYQTNASTVTPYLQMVTFNKNVLIVKQDCFVCEVSEKR